MTQVHHNCDPARLLAALLVLHRGFEQDAQAAKQSRIIAARSEEEETTRHSAARNRQPKQLAKQQQHTLAGRPSHVRIAVAKAASAAPIPATLVATVVEVLDVCPSTVVSNT